jgi:hypothetical protein
VQSDEVFSLVCNEGSLVYERSACGYSVAIVKHTRHKVGDYYLSYIAIPKGNKFYGVQYEELDKIDLPIFFTYSEYSTDKSHWIVGFDGDMHLDLHESLDLANEAYEFFLGVRCV